MIRSLKLVFGIALVLLTACRPDKANLKGWDAASWISDENGCAGKRANLWQNFKEQKHRFLGIEENQLGSLLGYPLSKELMERGQKIYRYYLHNGLKCGGQTKILAFRVSAMHTITEITEE